MDFRFQTNFLLLTFFTYTKNSRTRNLDYQSFQDFGIKNLNTQNNVQSKLTKDHFEYETISVLWTSQEWFSTKCFMLNCTSVWDISDIINKTFEGEKVTRFILPCKNSATEYVGQTDAKGSLQNSNMVKLGENFQQGGG